jgi:NADH-quinone oxidoreductase subunit G/[NiFe] hydrogenase diaphorase moiety small subunit
MAKDKSPVAKSGLRGPESDTQRPAVTSTVPTSEKPHVVPAGRPTDIGGTVSVKLDDMELKVPFGMTILEAAKTAGIRIPTLCYHEDLCLAGLCRICVVEVSKQRTLQTACTFPITEPIQVTTYSPRVRQARRHVLDLLLSKHYGECYSCFRNNNCELQALAKEYGVDFFRFGHAREPKYEVDRSSYSVVRDMNKCVLCRRCVRTCIDLQSVGVLTAADRGDRTRIETFMDRPLADVICINCGQCINRCPTGALRAKDPSDEIWSAIDSPKKHVVVQTAPSPRAAIGEAFDLPAGTSVTQEMNTALRRAGFDRVFDTNTTADLTIIEEGTELLLRLYRALVKGEAGLLPQLTSCSPGWVKFIEHFYPEYLSLMSSCKSPQQMFGALIKSYYAPKQGLNPADIVSVSLMPCSAKKFEANRPEMCASGYKDVDYGLTTREMAQMVKEAGLDLPRLPKTHFDLPFGDASGAGLIFGATGGVMEAALRTVVELVTGLKAEQVFTDANVVPVRGFDGIKYMEIPVPQLGEVPGLYAGLVKKGRLAADWHWLRRATLKVAVAHGTANARRIMDDIKAGGKFAECHFIEIMACPGGCLGGGGQPIPTSPAIRAARARAIYAEDMGLPVRKSHENPHVLKLYEEFLTDGPCGEQSHKYLHTHYTPRGDYLV